jgi:CRISPR-associated endonuclease/helicase Cas3
VREAVPALACEKPMEVQERFPLEFKALTGYGHFPWQFELYKRLIDGNVPDLCNFPTGFGKTSVISIWILALARVFELQPQGTALLPRRLVYVVNRRTVVDRSTEEAVRLRNRLV